MAGAASGDNKATGESGEGTRSSGTAAAAAAVARSRSGTKPENKDDPNKEKEKVTQAKLDETESQREGIEAGRTALSGCDNVEEERRLHVTETGGARRVMVGEGFPCPRKKQSILTYIPTVICFDGSLVAVCVLIAIYYLYHAENLPSVVLDEYVCVMARFWNYYYPFVCFG